MRTSKFGIAGFCKLLVEWESWMQASYEVEMVMKHGVTMVLGECTMHKNVEWFCIGRNRDVMAAEQTRIV